MSRVSSMARVLLITLAGALLVAHPEGSNPLMQLRRGRWTAAPDADPHLRRLQSSGPPQQYSVIVSVLRMDTFGAEHSRVDVSFVPPGHSVKDRLTVSFPGTGGNIGSNVPMDLHDGASVNITGYVEADSAQAAAIKASTLDQAQVARQHAAGVRWEEADTRGVFVVSDMDYEPNAAVLPRLPRLGQLEGLDGGPAGRRLNPIALTAAVVLVEVCGTPLQMVTKDLVESGFFGSGIGSFNQVMGVCSRNMVSFSGKVLDKVQVCSEDCSSPLGILDAVQTKLQGLPDWENSDYKLLIVPSNWLAANGIGTLGGTTSWYSEVRVCPQLYLHEIGHNWVLHHASGSVTSQEYMDTSSAMGYCCETRCHNFLHSWQLGFAGYQEEALFASHLLAGVDSTTVKLKALGTDFTSGLLVYVDTIYPGDWSSVPAILAISWRGTLGFDQYLEGGFHGNTVQVHHFQPEIDGRASRSLTYLLHEVRRGSTIIIWDTDRQSHRLFTSMKMQVKGLATDPASDTVDVVLCPRLLNETWKTPTEDLQPCPPSSASAARTDWTSVKIEGEFSFAGVQCSEVSYRVGKFTNGMRAGLALAFGTTKAAVTPQRVQCSDPIVVSYMLKVPAKNVSAVAEKIVSISQVDLASNLNTGFATEGFMLFNLAVTNIGAPEYEGSGEMTTTTAATTTTLATTTSQVATTMATTTTTMTTTTTTEFIFRGGPWSQFFSDQAGSESVAATKALVAVGCSGQFCASMRLSHREDIALHNTVATIHQLQGDVDYLGCQVGQIAMKFTCVGSSCTSFQLHCALPKSGKVIFESRSETPWFPSQVHGVEDGMCPGDTVVVGMRCGGAQCATKKLTCAVYQPGSCIPACGILSLECGDDGCGGSCGSCQSHSSVESAAFCRGDIGRCVHFATTEWAQSGKEMTKTNLVSTGMGCAGRYCESVNLIQMSASIDAASSEKSGWISDNTGKRWFWNRGTQAEDQVADCPDGMAVTWVECTGKYCDNLRFLCAKPLQWVVDMTEEPVVTDWFSEEQQRMDCDKGKVVTGVECEASKRWCIRSCGEFCDNKRLRCRSIRPEKAGAAVLGILASTDMPKSTQAVPPASSPWWSGASNMISDAWNSVNVGTGSMGVSGASQACTCLSLAVVMLAMF